MLSFILLVISVQGSILNFNPSSDSFDKCITYVANNYLTNSAMLVVDQDNSTINFKNFDHPKIQFCSPHFDTLTSYKRNQNNYILVYEHLEQLNVTLAKLKAREKSWSSRGRFLITVTKSTQQDEVRAIIQVLWTYNVYNSLVAVLDGVFTNFYTYDLVRSGCGENIVAERINQCTGGLILLPTQLYERKIGNNMCNTSLKVLWCPAPPFAIDYTLEKNPGILLLLVELVGERSNLTVEFVGNTSRYQSELEYREDRAFIAEDLNSHYGDMFVSVTGQDLKKCGSIYDCTVPAHHEIIYWMIPKPLKNPFWKSITTPFTSTTWLALVFVAFILPALIFWLTTRQNEQNQAYQSFARSVILALRINLGESDNLLPKAISFRTCFAFFSLSCLIIDTSYQGKLFLFLSNPGYEKGIATLDDILSSGLPMIFQQGFGFLFLYTGEKNQQVFERFEAIDLAVDEILYDAVKRRDFITIAPGGQITVNPHLRRLFNTLDIYFLYVVLLLRRDHFLLEHFDRALRRITESGFCDKWVADIELEYLKQPLAAEAKEVFRLTIDHLQGAFILLGIGYLFAILVFVMEAISTKVAQGYSKYRRFLHGDDE